MQAKKTIDNMGEFGGFYSITSKRNGKALEVAGASSDNGGAIQVYTYAEGQNQQWEVKDAGEGFYKLINRHSGKALDVISSGTTNGAWTHQWEDIQGAQSQLWQLVKEEDGSFKIKSSLSGKCLDIIGMSDEDG
ncbi:MAG: RICIN domain-containing protein, partial [Massilioclostridium sp.]|nr:RICIN domain-containing protein [Massilioclostridium sp.]